MKFNVGLGCALAAVALVSCNRSQPVNTGAGGPSAKPALSKLGIEDTKVGSGSTAEVGDMVYMQYRGTLGNGVEFDSNTPHDPTNPDKPPFMFELKKGHAEVIDGWNQGIVGMKVGGERKLSIPWSLAYGDHGQGLIGSKADLYFDVKLLWIMKPGHETEVGFSDLKKGSGPEAKDKSWVTISYTVKLVNDLLVDDSAKHDPGTLQFQAGTGDLGGKAFVPLQGVVQGVIGMRVGGERLLILTPGVASNPYARDQKVPPGSILRFDVKLLKVSDKKGPALPAAPEAKKQ